MIDMLADELRLAIQQLHGCPSRLIEVVPLSADPQAQNVLGGAVHVFEMIGHPSALRCYAWASPRKTNSTTMHAVLHTESVKSAELAVKSAARSRTTRSSAGARTQNSSRDSRQG
jgi:hypothetical protein